MEKERGREREIKFEDIRSLRRLFKLATVFELSVKLLSSFPFSLFSNCTTHWGVDWPRRGRREGVRRRDKK